jgi:hypothetical protein
MPRSGYSAAELGEEGQKSNKWGMQWLQIVTSEYARAAAAQSAANIATLEGIRFRRAPRPCRSLAASEP